MVTNARHYEALKKAILPLTRVLAALQPADDTAADAAESQFPSDNYGCQVPSDLLAIDIRESLHYLGEITGEITPADLLQTIFSRFCIGK